MTENSIGSLGLVFGRINIFLQTGACKEYTETSCSGLYQMCMKLQADVTGINILHPLTVVHRFNFTEN